MRWTDDHQNLAAEGGISMSSGGGGRASDLQDLGRQWQNSVTAQRTVSDAGYGPAPPGQRQAAYDGRMRTAEELRPRRREERREMNTADRYALAPAAEDINGRLSAIAPGFSVRQGYQPRDPVIDPPRGARAPTYAAMVRDLDTDGSSGQALRDFQDNRTDFGQLSPPAQALAAVVNLAEVGRGYTQAPDQLREFADGVASGEFRWAQFPGRFPPAGRGDGTDYAPPHQ